MRRTLVIKLVHICVFAGLLSARSSAQPQKLIHFWDFNNTVPLTGIGDVAGNGDSLGNPVHPLFANYTTLPLTFPKIVYSRPKAIQAPAATKDSVLDNDGIGSFYYDFSSNHYPYYITSDSSAAAAACACSGNLYIQARNPTLNSYLYMYVPTTGYINVTLSYAISATNNKAAQYNVFSYSTNGGVTWNKLTTAMDTFNIGGIKYPDTLLALNPITKLKLWYPIHIDFTSDLATNNNNGFIVRFFLAGSNATGSTGNNKYDNIAIQGDSICPVIWLQPLNATICNGENTDFVTKVVGGLNDVYQWQVNTGSGFTNVINGGVYAGATTDSLILTTVPPGMNGYTYRCIISCISCNNDTSATALLTVNPPPAVTANASVTAVCAGGSVTLTGGGAVSYTWTGGVTNGVPFVPVSTKTYTVTGTGANGCTDTASIAITVNPLPIVTANTSATVICAGASVTLTGGGAVSYAWTGGVSDGIAFNPPSTKTYTVTGTDINGCTNTASIAITVNPLPVLNVSPPTPSICFGNSIILTAAGANTYSWSPSAGLSCTACSVTNASPAITTKYTLVGTSSLGCIDSTTVNVIVAPKIFAAISGKDTICSGTSTVLIASGGGTYLWNTGATSSSITISPLSNTTYSVLVTVGTCTDSAKQAIVVNPSPIPAINGITSICVGSNTMLTASGGGTYSWNTGATTSSISVSPAITTSYTVAVSNGLCITDTSITVTVHNIPAVIIPGAQTVCQGIPDTIIASGGTSYSWNTGATTSSIIVTPPSTTTFSVSVSNGFCIKDTTVSVTVNPEPNANLTGNNAICSGDSTTLTATGGISYAWNNGATTSSVTVAPVINTTYTVQVSNGLCILSKNLLVTVTQTPILTISGTQTICAGNAADLLALGGATYSWLPSASLNAANVANPLASPTGNTTYTVTMANGNCKATDSVKVVVNPLPVEAAVPDTTIQITESTPIMVTPQNAGNTYVWLPETGLSCTSCPSPVASPLVTTTYSVTTTDALGCSSTEKVTVTVIDDCGRLFVPNAFSPNGDGHNDILFVYGVCIVSMDFIVFDRWGNKIFESTDQSTGWDGTYKGQRMNPDTYTYMLNVKLVDGTKIAKSGNVGLVR